MTGNIGFGNTSWKYPLWTKVLREARLGAVAVTLAGSRTQGLEERGKGDIRGDPGGSSCCHHVLRRFYSSSASFFPFSLSLSRPQPLATTLLHPVSMNLSVLGTSYKGNHAILILLCLADVTERRVQGSFLL